MEVCLLCLDKKENEDNVIKIASPEWQAENIKILIEKYLWSLDAKVYSVAKWICFSCWHELKDFHKFYERIREAHANLTLQEVKKPLETEHLYYNNDHKIGSAYKEELIEETEILIEQPLNADHEIESENPLIKVELDNDFSVQNIKLKQKRKRGRPPKDSMNISGSFKEKTKNHKSNDNKIKPKNVLNHLDITDEVSIRINDHEHDIKTETEEFVQYKNESNEIEESDTDYEEHEEKQSLENCKKKRKNPDEKTRKEHDKLIAEYFKIFCSLCQISLDNFISLRKHFREEHNKRGFVICCKKKIFTRPILVDHINFHLDPNYFKCKECGKTYSDRCTLESHMKTHEDGQQERHHACDICGKTFVGPTQLETHKQTHQPDYEKKFSCAECGKFFSTLYSLNYHVQAIHHNKYVKICDICGKTMRCRNSFKLHMEKHDNKLATPINCDICGLRLIDRRGLRRHKNSQHPVGGKKEYSCHVCSKISPNLRALRTHIRFAHETGYIHKCTMCDKAFKRPEALKEHTATHTGTPLYTCPWCPKTFISNGNMHNHRKKSHPKEWEEAQKQKYGGIFPSNYKPPTVTNANISNT
ncbi:transcription factor grauzone-like [Cochliomyia hominivorax]